MVGCCNIALVVGCCVSVWVLDHCYRTAGGCVEWSGLLS